MIAFIGDVHRAFDRLATIVDGLPADVGAVVQVGDLGLCPSDLGVAEQCALRLARFLRREQVGLVHAHQYTPFFYGLLARLLHRAPAVLFTEHGRHFPDFPRPKRKVAKK